MSSSDKLKIPLQEISSATNGFAEANIIGKGGYGLVYRGQSEQHGMLAIKRLNRVHGQGEHEYGMEVTLLSRYKHENLVSLIGFCGEGDEKILVYKYEANQSLDKFLHSKDLSWIQRLHICLGAARGLKYLHNETGSGHGVIHRDIKSPNILLDENWNAKISDFGLSKIALTNSADSIVFTTACGTMGYVDPQILYGCGITQKSDVYSFGVVLYEVLFGKLVAIPGYPGKDRFTVVMAKKHYEAKTLHMMIDPHLRYQMNSDSLSSFSTIAYQCLEIRTEDRPTMSLVVEALEKALGYQQASSGFLFDVYISNFGVESENIVNCLYDALKEEGLTTYKDKIRSSLNKSELLTVIKQSRNYIIVFSKNFGANDGKLDEVAEIIECEKERGSLVTSVFWDDVRPYEVREQKGYFGEAMSKYDTHPRMEVWRYALLQATYVKCFSPRDDRPCEAFAKKIVARISSARSSQKSNEPLDRSHASSGYDVYISSSFGVETETIVNCLYDALEEGGFSTCKDKSSLNKSQLLSVIKQSSYFIIILSKNFGANDWNLDEVAEIFESEKERGSFVTSIFWEVSPYEVREQKGYFGKAMSKYQTHPRMGIWRNALLDATYVQCFSPRDDRPCDAFAKKVVACISSARSSKKSKTATDKAGKLRKKKQPTTVRSRHGGSTTRPLDIPSKTDELRKKEHPTVVRSGDGGDRLRRVDRHGKWDGSGSGSGQNKFVPDQGHDGMGSDQNKSMPKRNRFRMGWFKRFFS